MTARYFCSLLCVDLHRRGLQQTALAHTHPAQHVHYIHGTCICTLSKYLGYSGHLLYTYIQHCMYITVTGPTSRGLQRTSIVQVQPALHTLYSHGTCTLSKDLGYSGHPLYTCIQHCIYIYVQVQPALHTCTIQSWGLHLHLVKKPGLQRTSMVHVHPALYVYQSRDLHLERYSGHLLCTYIQHYMYISHRILQPLY